MPKSKTKRMQFFAERFRKQNPKDYQYYAYILHKMKKAILNGNN